MSDKRNNIFTLDDGTREIIVQNNFGEEICKLHIRSGDLSIMDRYKKLMEEYPEIVKPLSDLHVEDDGSSDISAEWEIIKGVEAKLIEKIDYVFGMKDAKKLFASRNAFSGIGGSFYIEKVLAMLGNVVAQTIDEEGEKTRKRLEKYTKDLEDGIVEKSDE